MNTILIALTCAFAAALAVSVQSHPPSIMNNHNPTIWAHSTVEVMKAQIENLYQLNLALYANRTIFDPAHPFCQVPVPPGSYTEPTVCQQGDLLAAEIINASTSTWSALAESMFPVFYGQPDNANEPRADFSDFSHFYNHMLLEIEILQNITSYYTCKGNFMQNSATWTAIYDAYFNDNNLVIVEMGPPYVNSNGDNVSGENGTYSAYPPKGLFFHSIHLNSHRFETGWGGLLGMQAGSNPDGLTAMCKTYSENGLPPPTAPRNLP